MTRRCFLHVGTHKTGTTSIQRMLNSRRAALRSVGYYYPLIGLPSASIPGQHNIAWQLADDPHFQPEFGSVDDLIAEVRGVSEHIVLSSEDFSGVIIAHPLRFSDFVALLKSVGFTVTLVLYFRNYLEWLPRVYLTYVQAGWDLTWSESLSANISPGTRAFEILCGRGADPSQWRWIFPYYLELLRKAHGVGADQVIVRQYQQHSGCSDFLSILNLTLLDIELVREFRENTALSLREYLLTFMRNRLRRDITAEECAFIAAAVPVDETRIQLSPAESRKLLDRFGETNRILWNDYGIPEPTIIGEGAAGHHIDVLFSSSRVMLPTFASGLPFPS